MRAAGWPGCSQRSCATRSARPIAATRRGCVQMMLQLPPAPASMRASRMSCGTCVDLPHPVSPTRTTTGLAATASIKAPASLWIGSFCRCCQRARQAPDLLVRVRSITRVSETSHRRRIHGTEGSPGPGPMGSRPFVHACTQHMQACLHRHIPRTFSFAPILPAAAHSPSPPPPPRRRPPLLPRPH